MASIIQDRLAEIRQRGLRKDRERFEAEVDRVKALRGTMDLEEWLRLAIPLVKRQRELEDAEGWAPERVTVTRNNPFYDHGGEVDPGHSWGWEQGMAARRRWDCHHLGGLPVGCHSGCKWRNRGCELHRRWWRLFDEPSRYVIHSIR